MENIFIKIKSESGDSHLLLDARLIIVVGPEFGGGEFAGSVIHLDDREQRTYKSKNTPAEVYDIINKALKGR